MNAECTAPRLAVVIPIYKGKHLVSTLESFAAQTDRRFRVYIADDCSPENLAAIVEPYRSRLDLVHRRFDQNVGQKSVIAHYDRAIRMAREPWVWLFSDDDLAAPDCVEAFLQGLAEKPDSKALFRFQMTMVAEDGQELPVKTAYPPHETWGEYTAGLMRPETWVVVPNVIFPRSAYDENGGFYDFPQGLWSDLLSWSRLAHRGGIETLRRGRVYYRRHYGSISAGFYFGHGDKRQLLESMRLMMVEMRRLCDERGASDLIPRRVQLAFYCRQFRFLARSLHPEELRQARATLRELWPASPLWREAVFGWNRLFPRLRELRGTLRSLGQSMRPKESRSS